MDIKFKYRYIRYVTILWYLYVQFASILGTCNVVPLERWLKQTSVRLALSGCIEVRDSALSGSYCLQLFEIIDKSWNWIDRVGGTTQVKPPEVNEVGPPSPHTAKGCGGFAWTSYIWLTDCRGGAGDITLAVYRRRESRSPWRSIEWERWNTTS